MLGVSSLIFPLLNMDINTCDKEDIQLVSLFQKFSRTIKNKEHNIFVRPQYLQIMEFREQLDSLEICDANFNLKLFWQIYDHFASRCEGGAIIAQHQGIPKIHPYSCELCLAELDP